MQALKHRCSVLHANVAQVAVKGALTAPAPHGSTAVSSAFWCKLGCGMLQAHVSQVAMKGVLRALEQHRNDTDIQAKGLVVLGVLGQVRVTCLALTCDYAASSRHIMHPMMHHLAASRPRMMMSAKLTEYTSECHRVHICGLNAYTVQYVLYSGKCRRQQLL